jgi:hypothetical protein
MKNTNFIFIRSTLGIGSHTAKQIHKSLGINNRKSPILSSENQKKKILVKLRTYPTGSALKHLNLEYNSFKEITKTYSDFKKIIKLKGKNRK